MYDYFEEKGIQKKKKKKKKETKHMQSNSGQSAGMAGRLANGQGGISP